MLALRAGTFLGNYEIVRAIGSGGVGAVYEARHRALGRRVAVKVLHAHAFVAGSDVASARFLREGRAAAQVRHPHVVDVFDFGVEDGVPFLVMELIEGETLAQLLARGGALPLPLLAEVVLPVLSAVSALHAAGIIHRDLKPANILLALDRSRALCPKVADFGVSRLDDGAGAATESNAVVGTFAYMAPEQARASKYANERSDQYALGVVLYECATGVRPFAATSPVDLLYAILHEVIVPPSAKNPALPAAFDALVLRALSRDAEQRFASVDELAKALLPFADANGMDRWTREMVQAAEQRASGAVAPAHPSEGFGRPSAATDDRPLSSSSSPSPLANTFQPLIPQTLPMPLDEPVASAPAAAIATRSASSRRLLRIGGMVSLVVLLGFAASRWIPRHGSVLAPRSPSSATSVTTTEAACHSNAECTTRLGKPSLCAHQACATLESQDCHVLADPDALAREDTLWFGSVYALTGPESEIGQDGERATDLARQDFAQARNGLRTDENTHVPQFGVVSCDEAVDATRAVRHLVEDLGVPVILGFHNAAEIIALNPILANHHVLTLATLSTSPLLTQLPRASGEPPMIWRMSYSLSESASALSKLITTTIEPDLHREGIRRVRVANVRGKAPGYLAFSERLFGRLRFNDKSALENGEDFGEFVFDDGDPNAKGLYESGLARLRDFDPDIVIYAGTTGIVRQVLQPFVRARSPSSRARPRFLSGAELGHLAAELVGKDADLRARVFGLTLYSTTRVNALFTMHFNGAYDTRVSRANAPSTPYDGFYVAAYAAFALPADLPPTGPNLALAIGKLVPPGASIDVGPSGIYGAYEALHDGRTVDLVGAGGTLDFNQQTGEHVADLSVLCMDVDKHGSAVGSLESGMIYSAATDSLMGKMRCP